MTFFTRQFLVNYFCFSLLTICLCLAVSCKKPSGDDILRFSYVYINDEGKAKYVIDTKITMTFDTVFTSIGSITRNFLVHNTSNQEITIKSIYLAGGTHSMYSINVNGVPGVQGMPFKDITIPKKDSIFVFVKVNINPQNQNNPFLVTDSIVFLTGSRVQDVKLLAYGQDARYIIADPETGVKVVAGKNETVKWTKERPYVVYGWAGIDTLGTLEIEAGTRIYFHNNSGLWAYRYSNLNANGTLEEPVLFRGDLLEKQFDEDYNQWNRILINEGANANINYAIISNAFIGVQVDPLPDKDGITITPNSLVKIENTIIKNTKQSGVLSRFLNLEMTNCLIINNGGCGLQLECGQYTMKHLTIANYFKQNTRKTPACYVSNKISDAAYKDIPPQDTKVDFQNCIIYGNYKKEEKIESEIVVHKEDKAELKAKFKNCLMQIKNGTSYPEDCVFEGCERNKDPKFTDINKFDFKLLPESPAIGIGLPNIGVPFDILGNPRGDKPDLGAYQFVR